MLHFLQEALNLNRILIRIELVCTVARISSLEKMLIHFLAERWMMKIDAMSWKIYEAVSLA